MHVCQMINEKKKPQIWKRTKMAVSEGLKGGNGSGE